MTEPIKLTITPEGLAGLFLRGKFGSIADREDQLRLADLFVSYGYECMRVIRDMFVEEEDHSSSVVEDYLSIAEEDVKKRFNQERWTEQCLNHPQSSVISKED